jgi:hypothetical protein
MARMNVVEEVCGRKFKAAREQGLAAWEAALQDLVARAETEGDAEDLYHALYELGHFYFGTGRKAQNEQVLLRLLHMDPPPFPQLPLYLASHAEWTNMDRGVVLGFIAQAESTAPDWLELSQLYHYMLQLKQFKLWYQATRGGDDEEVAGAAQELEMLFRGRHAHEQLLIDDLPAVAARLKRKQSMRGVLRGLWLDYRKRVTFEGPMALEKLSR